MSITTTREPRRMAVEKFIGWATRQPDGKHYELHDGVVVRMPNETSLHGLTKGRIAHRLFNAIEQRNLPCHVYIDAMAVQVSDDTVFEPDIVVRCGDRLPDDAVKVTDPIIAIEVLSRSTRGADFGRKQEGYLQISGLHHYLIVNPQTKRIVHHRRQSGGTFETSIHGDGPLALDPPGITIDRLFA